MGAQRREVPDRHVGRDVDDDIDQSPALPGQKNREPPDQARTSAAVERLVVGKPGNNSAEVVRLVSGHALLRSRYWAQSRQIIFFSLASWLR
jgi:hypothetical protein